MKSFTDANLYQLMLDSETVINLHQHASDFELDQSECKLMQVITTVAHASSGQMESQMQASFELASPYILLFKTRI